jgi:hypothetical protein
MQRGRQLKKLCSPNPECAYHLAETSTSNRSKYSVDSCKNGSTGSARLISTDNLPLSRKTRFGSVELLRSNRSVEASRLKISSRCGSLHVTHKIFM